MIMTHQSGTPLNTGAIAAAGRTVLRYHESIVDNVPRFRKFRRPRRRLTKTILWSVFVFGPGREVAKGEFAFRHAL